jgi:23S rRNA G2445 N2-methylase RlmL
MKMHFCAPCHFGLEGLVADELRRLDMPGVSAGELACGAF